MESDPYLIQTIEAFPLNLPLHEPFSIATGAQHAVQNVLVKITLENGLVGIGEAAPFPAVSGETQGSALHAIASIQNYLIGKDIRRWKLLAVELQELMGHQHAALCGVHMALVDAVGKSFGISAAVLFGGASDTLTTDMTVTAADVQHAEDSARSILARGINTIKIKTVGADAQHDFERIRVIRKVAPQAALTVDGNCGYSYDRAMQLTDLLRKEKIDLQFFEQPFPREHWSEKARFARESGMKVAADESARDAADVLRIIQEKSAHVINIKLMKCGLIEALRMTELAKAAGLELMIGGMVESILAMTFSAHFAAGLGGFQYADLDTPLFIQTHDFKGGMHYAGEKITIDLQSSGHGVTI
jgi:L-alanine-DL-glutamate epimerase-like enolase superfamily enzyme